MSVTIRFRELKKKKKKSSNESYVCYLDIYNKGKRDYEYPENLYVSKDYSKLDNILEIDKRSIAFAEKLKRTIELEISEGRYGFISSRKRKSNFITFFRRLSEEKAHNSWTSTLNKLIEFIGENVSFEDLDEQKIKQFIKFLQSKLSPTSARHYCIILNVALNEAVRNKYIYHNPFKFISKSDRPQKQKKEIIFLTDDEVLTLIQTEFEGNQQIKQCFLFSCFSGLRISDLSKLKHSDIVNETLRFRQKKSKEKFLYQPLHPFALTLLNQVTKSSASDLVFWDIPAKYSYHLIPELRSWIAEAKIGTRISGWHTGRTTFSVSWLSNGGDIYVLSKYLGHSSVKITEDAYGEIIPDTKLKNLVKIPIPEVKVN